MVGVPVIFGGLSLLATRPTGRLLTLYWIAPLPPLAAGSCSSLICVFWMYALLEIEVPTGNAGTVSATIVMSNVSSDLSVLALLASLSITEYVIVVVAGSVAGGVGRFGVPVILSDDSVNVRPSGSALTA